MLAGLGDVGCGAGEEVEGVKCDDLWAIVNRVRAEDLYLVSIAAITLKHLGKDWPLAMRLRGIGEHLSDRPLGLPTLPLNLPVRAQLQMRDGRCWEAVYSTASLNSSQMFQAEAD